MTRALRTRLRILAVVLPLTLPLTLTWLSPAPAAAQEPLRKQADEAIKLHDAGKPEASQAFRKLVKAYNERRDLTSADLTAVGIAARYLGDDDPEMFKDALRAFDEAARKDPKNLEPRLLAGEMLLDKYNSRDAKSEFEDVLRIEPHNARALLGQARAAD